MTREEAVKVLEANHYCVKHLERMKHELFVNFAYGFFWHCLLCDEELKRDCEIAQAKRDAELAEAIALLKGTQ